MKQGKENDLYEVIGVLYQDERGCNLKRGAKNLTERLFLALALSSVSKIGFRAVFAGKGEAKINIYRHLSPVTVSNMQRMNVLAGRITRFQDTFIYAPLGVRVGVEKAKKQFKRGEVAFMSSTGAVCFFIRDATVGMGMNPLGEVVSGMEIIEKCGAGDTVQLIEEKSI